MLCLIRNLCLVKAAKPFLKPVDSVALQVEDYYDIVLNPIDLTTMKKKILNN